MIKPQVNTGEHGIKRVYILSFSSVLIRVHPWLKKDL
jgi:hypothetical protein